MTLIAITFAEVRLISECYRASDKRNIAIQFAKNQQNEITYLLEEKREKVEKQKRQQERYKKMKIKYTGLKLEKVLRKDEIETLKSDIQARGKKSQLLENHVEK